jgi:hypothetical protein
MKVKKTNIEMAGTEDGPVNIRYKQLITGVSSLGKEIKISPKASVQLCDPGFTAEFYVPTVTLNIGIGKDNTADLIMTAAAWEALKAGKEVNITTAKEFRTRFLGHKR